MSKRAFRVRPCWHEGCEDGIAVQVRVWWVFWRTLRRYPSHATTQAFEYLENLRTGKVKP